MPKKEALEAAGASEGTSVKGRGSIKLQPKELMAALPGMSQEQKKQLQKALKEDEEEQMYKQIKFAQEYTPWMAVGFDMPDHYNESVRKWVKEEPGDLGQGSGSASSGSGPIRPPSKDESLPKPLRDRELQAFRQQLYNQQSKGGRLIPSRAAPIPTEQQAVCGHPFGSLRWSGNQDGHYAKCKDCDLKSVIYWSNKHGAMMAAME